MTELIRPSNANEQRGGAIHTPVGKVLLTVEEAQHALGCGKTTLHSLIRSGELKSLKLTPKARRIPVQAIHEFVAARMTDAS